MEQFTTLSGRRSNDGGPESNSGDSPSHARTCIACRASKPREIMVRLTVDYGSGIVALNSGKPAVQGRSAYLCRSQSCLAQALKGTKLKALLEGRKGKKLRNQRTVKWPLEPQLIQEISTQCTEL